MRITGGAPEANRRHRGRSVARAGRFAVAALAVATLAGCGSVHPGSAAAFDGRSITFDQVDALASSICAANLDGADPGATSLPSRRVRLTALQVLLDSQLSLEFGEQQNADPDPALVARALESNQGGVDALPEARQAAFRDGLRAYADAQATLVVIGRRSLEKQGQSGADISNAAALSEGSKLRSQWLKTQDVSVDPRFGTFTAGNVVAGDSSLSVAQSADARAGSKAQPSTSYTDSLPASQLCS